MFGRKKVKKRDIDEKLLQDIYRAKEEWVDMNIIVKRSLEPDDRSYYLLSVAEAKYFYLLREARHRKINALR